MESDHRPLQHIHKKNLMQAPPRLQRILLRLQAYDIEIRYKPGKEMVVADALSRLSPVEKHEIPEMKVRIHHVVSVTPTKLELIRQETATDMTLQLLKQQVTDGWPDSIKKIQCSIRPYWSVRDDVAIEDGTVLVGSRIVIPNSLRQNILQQIHSGHQGIDKCKLRAKSCVYWPGIYKDIDNMVTNCHACQKYQRSQQREPMISMEVPPRPWHTLGADLFHHDKVWYLIIADYYSKFPFIRKLDNLTASTITRVSRVLFAEQGIPEVIVCDNGTQFTSSQFRALAQQYGFRIQTSSPYYPRGHGFIERHIQTMKRILTKCRESGDDPNLALLTLRATPLKSNLASPAELLNRRKYKTTLPSVHHPPPDRDDVRDILQADQSSQTQYYNRRSTSTPIQELLNDQPIYIQNPINKTWSQGRVMSKSTTPRSYNVETESGSQLRRNRVHLRPAPLSSTKPTPVRNAPSQPQSRPLSNRPSGTPTVTRSGRRVNKPNRLDL